MADDHVTKYDVMPIPPVAANTRYFEAGAVTFAVQYRLLDDAIAAASQVEGADGEARGPGSFNDRGVALHVFANDGGERRECLRFDCFEEDPHYHYISWQDRFNHMIHLDPVADGDPLGWALERLRTRLGPMLARAGAGATARALDPATIEAVLPRVSEAAYRARFHHDDESVRQAALGNTSGP